MNLGTDCADYTDKSNPFGDKTEPCQSVESVPKFIFDFTLFFYVHSDSLHRGIQDLTYPSILKPTIQLCKQKYAG